MTKAVWLPSPNFGARRDSGRNSGRGTVAPDLILIHYTAMASAEAALHRLCDPAFEVSAHYLVGEDGRLWQMVRDEDRAWHAGAGAWGTCRDVNSRSIGIELANAATHPFPEPQMARLETLLRGLMTRWSILPQGVLAHSDTAVGRKIDPGARFDWRRLARQGLAVWPQHRASGEFAHDARRFGYDWPAGAEDDLLAAFRMRFRPWGTGPIDDEDRRLMHDLATRWPCTDALTA